MLICCMSKGEKVVNEGAMPTEQETSEDIFFECPNCGQSMSIDPKAAGLIVNCSGCSSKVQIPTQSVQGAPQVSPPPPAPAVEPGMPDEQTRILLESLTSSQTRIQEMSENYNEVQRRRAFLERMRVENLQLFSEINEHIEQIKTSYDRLVEIMNDAP